MSHNDDWVKEENEMEARKNAARVSAVASASDIAADPDRIRDLESEVGRLKTSMAEHFTRDHLAGDGPEIDRWRELARQQDGALQKAHHVLDGLLNVRAVSDLEIQAAFEAVNLALLPANLPAPRNPGHGAGGHF
jgi:hypothetical protein